jgi:capsular exopolysaccharide synthesis family protein
LQPFNSNAEFKEAELSDQIDIKEILLALYRQKFAILGLALLGAIIAFYYASTLQPIYKASGTLLIDRQSSGPSPIKDNYYGGYGDWEFRETQYQLLRSRNLAERVVRKLELQNNPKYAASPNTAEEDESGSWFDLSFLKPASFTKAPPAPKELTDEEREQALVTNLSQMITGGINITPVPDSKLVTISYSSADPEFAATVVNTLADQYVESLLDASLQSALKASEWLTIRLEELRENLKASENRLQAYREQEKLVDVQGIATLSTQELSNLSQKYSEAKAQRQNLALVKRELDDLKGAKPSRYLDIPVVQKHPLIAPVLEDLSDAERRLDELGKRYGVKHPKIIAAKSEVAAVSGQLKDEMQKVLAGIKTEYQLAQESERELKEQLEASREVVQSINRKEFAVQALQREVDTNRQLYDMFFTRLKETDQIKGLESANSRIIDRALVPSGPSSPNIRLIVIVGIFGGALLGAGIALLLYMVDNTVKTPEEVETKLKARVLGVLPLQKVKKNGYAELYWENQDSIFSEHIRTLRTGLILGGLDKPLQVIVMTSSVPHEGKSTISLDLGAAFSKLEKTLVIGADMRRPSLASKCKFSPRHPGLSNYIAGSAELEECIVSVGEEELYVMPSGLIPPNPLEMLSSRAFRDALDALKQQFGRIIIDSAPIQAVSDAMILATYADTVCYVVCADTTHASVAKRGIERIRSTSVPVAGVVLNRFDAEKASKYYGTGYYGYDSYYQSENAPRENS